MHNADGRKQLRNIDMNYEEKTNGRNRFKTID